MEIQNSFEALSDLQESLKAGHHSVYQLVQDYLARIEAENDRLNIFNEVFAKEALNQAQVIDEKINTGNAGKLAGLVVGIKDNICYKGHAVTASSKILDGFESLYSATVTDRLLEADAIIIGRLNCDEFAMGSSNEYSAYGPAKNPLDETKVPGGSSGGASAAVAAGLCHATLGSDTGGSIRQPAAFCGVHGIKPTYGRVSRYGLIAFGSSFDQIGPITQSLEDTARILEIIAGQDDYDGTASSRQVPDYKKQLESFEEDGCQVAYLKDCIEAPSLAPVIHDAIQSLINNIQEKSNISTEEAELAYLDQMIPVYQILSNAEASSNLSRYDGILYGYRSPEAESLEDTILKSRTEGFGDEVKRRIMLGTFVLSEGYYEAYYSKAQKIRRLVKENLENLLSQKDFLILPATPSTAFEIGGKTDATALYWEDLFTIPASLSGLPAITVPIGTDDEGMPFSVQIIGNHFQEGRLLGFANKLRGYAKTN